MVSLCRVSAGARDERSVNTLFTPTLTSLSGFHSPNFISRVCGNGGEKSWIIANLKPQVLSMDSWLSKVISLSQHLWFCEIMHHGFSPPPTNYESLIKVSLRHIHYFKIRAFKPLCTQMFLDKFINLLRTKQNKKRDCLAVWFILCYGYLFIYSFANFLSLYSFCFLCAK